MYREWRVVPKLESRKKINDVRDKHLEKSSLSNSIVVNKDKVSSMASNSVLNHMDHCDQRSLSKNKISEGSFHHCVLWRSLRTIFSWRIISLLKFFLKFLYLNSNYNMIQKSDHEIIKVRLTLWLYLILLLIMSVLFNFPSFTEEFETEPWC